MSNTKVTETTIASAPLHPTAKHFGAVNISTYSDGSALITQGDHVISIEPEQVSKVIAALRLV